MQRLQHDHDGFKRKHEQLLLEVEHLRRQQALWEKEKHAMSHAQVRQRSPLELITAAQLQTLPLHYLPFPFLFSYTPSFLIFRFACLFTCLRFAVL